MSGHKRQNTGEIYGAPRGGDPIYYSTAISCQDVDDQGSHGQAAVFDESRTSPLLPNPNLYEVSVEAASIDTKSLPTYIMSTTREGDINKLQPLVGLELNWSGSLLPYDTGGAVANNASGGGGNWANTQIGLCTKGSSLPIKYSKRGLQDSFTPLQITSMLYNATTSNNTLKFFTSQNATGNLQYGTANPAHFTIHNLPPITGTDGNIIDFNGLTCQKQSLHQSCQRINVTGS